MFFDECKWLDLQDKKSSDEEVAMSKSSSGFMTPKELTDYLVKRFAQGFSRHAGDYRNPRNMSGGKAKNEAQQKRNLALDFGWKIIKEVIGSGRLDKDTYKTDDGGVITRALERLENGEGQNICACGGNCQGGCSGHGSGGHGSGGSSGGCSHGNCGNCGHKKP